MLPQHELEVRLRFRHTWCTRPARFALCREAEYQLDSELLRTVTGGGEPWISTDNLVDAVGIIVNGKLYIDDEPYWENLLEEGKTYSVAYLARPNISFQTKLWDRIFGTPVVQPSSIPKHTAKYSTTAQRQQLDAAGVFPLGVHCRHPDLDSSSSRFGDYLLKLETKYGPKIHLPGTLFQERSDRSQESLMSRQINPTAPLLSPVPRLTSLSAPERAEEAWIQDEPPLYLGAQRESGIGDNFRYDLPPPYHVQSYRATKQPSSLFFERKKALAWAEKVSE